MTKKTTEKTDMVTSYKHKIVTFLKAYKKDIMPINELETKCRTKKGGKGGQGKGQGKDQAEKLLHFVSSSSAGTRNVKIVALAH